MSGNTTTIVNNPFMGMNFYKPIRSDASPGTTLYPTIYPTTLKSTRETYLEQENAQLKARILELEDRYRNAHLRTPTPYPAPLLNLTDIMFSTKEYLEAVKELAKSVKPIKKFPLPEDLEDQYDID